MISSYLTPEEAFLKRVEDTFQLQRSFSHGNNESPGTIVQRISHVRYLGMKVHELLP